MQIIKVSDGQGHAEYYADLKLAFRRWLELDGEEVSFEVLEVITSPDRDVNPPLPRAKTEDKIAIEVWLNDALADWLAR